MHSKRNGRVSILYVDDEQFLHEPFKFFMEMDGEFSVETATSAAEAFDRLSTGHYDVVVSDYQMPTMNGIDFLRRLRYAEKRMPFILFTGRGREEVVIQAINNGADFYIQKGGDVQRQFAELMHFVRSATQKREAEESLFATEQQLSSFFDCSADVMALFDVEGHVLRLNSAAEALLGVETAKAAGRKLSDFQDVADSDGTLKRLGSLFAKVAHEGVMVHHDEVSHRKDGNVTHLSVDTMPVKDASGRMAFIASVGQDVTEKMCFQALVKAISDASSAVLRGMPVGDILSFLCTTVADIFAFKGVSIFLKEDDGSLALLSKAENVPGSVMEGHLRWDDSLGGQTVAGRAVRTGKTQVDRIDGPEYAHLKEFQLKATYNSVISIPIMSKYETTGVLCINGNDLEKLSEVMIAQLGTAAEAVSIAIQSSRERERRKLLEKALESASDTVVLTNSDGIIEWANSSFTRTTGYTKEEARGKTPRLLKSGKHDDAFYKNLWDTILSGNVFHAKLTNRRKNGELYFEDTVITPVRNETGAISSFIAIKRDITEQMRLDEELRKSAERYRTMLEDMAEVHFEMDLKGNITSFDDALCCMTGHRRENISGSSYTEYAGDDTAKDVDDALRRVNLAGKPETVFDWKVMGKEGSTTCVDASIQLVRDSEGKAKGFRVFAKKGETGR